MECKFNRTTYKRRLDNYSRHEHLTALTQSGKYSEALSRRSSGELEDTFTSTQTPAILSYEELGGLSEPGTQDCPHGILLLGYGIEHGSRPTSVVTTRSAVGLLLQ
jgi:hypothetical protein